MKITLSQGQIIEVKEKTKFKEIVDMYSKNKEIVLCKLNGKYYELDEEILNEGFLEFIDVNSEIGWKVYARTLQYIFIKATLDLFPNATITIQHSISKGTFGEIFKDEKLTKDDIEKIKTEMKNLIKRDIPITKVSVSKEKAINIFRDYKMEDKIRLLSQIKKDKVSLYELDGRYDYFYGDMAYSTGIIEAFDLILYAHGFVLRNPKEGDVSTLPEFKEQKALAKVFYETEHWINILGVGDVGRLNERILQGELTDIILVSEALHEKKIAYLADNISNKDNIKLVLIAGPSSSGKTTFLNRLAIQLKVNGAIPVKISLDDYFIDRVNSPKDENGNYDFESIKSIDLPLFNEHVNKLLKGNEIEIPRYNFKTGEREWHGEKLKLPNNGVILVEGIHGLNPILTKDIPDENKFKIYISALTQLNVDNHNRISTTDVRKTRRIVRDYLSRGYGAEETLLMWPSIKKGEKKNIFVYQEEADVMINSTLVYELCVLKPYAIKELKKIIPSSPVYYEACRLISFLEFFEEIDRDEVPKNSILKEFIGGSCFYKY